MNLEERLNNIKNGQDSSLYEFFGSHLGEKYGVQGAYFIVYSPNAKEIFVAGDFNNFDKLANPMQRIENSNVWETFIPGATEFQKYKYVIIDNLCVFVFPPVVYAHFPLIMYRKRKRWE